jgi:hypothetical protein
MIYSFAKPIKKAFQGFAALEGFYLQNITFSGQLQLLLYNQDNANVQDAHNPCTAQTHRLDLIVSRYSIHNQT